MDNYQSWFTLFNSYQHENVSLAIQLLDSLSKEDYRAAFNHIESLVLSGLNKIRELTNLHPIPPLPFKTCYTKLIPFDHRFLIRADVDHYTGDTVFSVFYTNFRSNVYIIKNHKINLLEPFDFKKLKIALDEQV